MRAVLDPNVLVSALLSRSGAPAQIASRWLAGEHELVVSELLLAELDRALAYPKIQEAERAVLVSGDQHLLGLADRFPIFAPREFLRILETHS